MTRIFVAALLLVLTFTHTACKDEITNGGITSCDFPAFTATADSCLVAIPNIFTPNADGFNDVFMIIFNNTGTSSLEDLHIVVQNEAATTVAEGFDTSFSWDGKIGGSTTFGVFTVKVTMTIDAAPYIFDSYVYCVPYNTSEFDPIDCADCRFATQFDGDSFDGGIDNSENICE